MMPKHVRKNLSISTVALLPQFVIYKYVFDHDPFFQTNVFLFLDASPSLSDVSLLTPCFGCVQTLREAVKVIMAKWKGAKGKSSALGDMMGDIIKTLPKYNVILKGDVAASIGTISIAEGLIMQLNPDFNVVANALPFFVRYKGWASEDAAMKGVE
jgi:hypothetical protein